MIFLLPRQGYWHFREDPNNSPILSDSGLSLMPSFLTEIDKGKAARQRAVGNTRLTRIHVGFVKYVPVKRIYACLAYHEHRCTFMHLCLSSFVDSTSTFVVRLNNP